MRSNARCRGGLRARSRVRHWEASGERTRRSARRATDVREAAGVGASGDPRRGRRRRAPPLYGRDRAAQGQHRGPRAAAQPRRLAAPPALVPQQLRRRRQLATEHRAPAARRQAAHHVAQAAGPRAERRPDRQARPAAAAAAHQLEVPAGLAHQPLPAAPRPEPAHHGHARRHPPEERRGPRCPPGGG